MKLLHALTNRPRVHRAVIFAIHVAQLSCFVSFFETKSPITRFQRILISVIVIGIFLTILNYFMLFDVVSIIYKLNVISTKNQSMPAKLAYIYIAYFAKTTSKRDYNNRP